MRGRGVEYWSYGYRLRSQDASASGSGRTRGTLTPNLDTVSDLVEDSGAVIVHPDFQRGGEVSCDTREVR